MSVTVSFFRKLWHSNQSVFKRSMPSDLIRGWVPVRIAIKFTQIAQTYLR
jgi:hypothetical protein